MLSGITLNAITLIVVMLRATMLTEVLLKEDIVNAFSHCDELHKVSVVTGRIVMLKAVIMSVIIVSSC